MRGVRNRVLPCSLFTLFFPHCSRVCVGTYRFTSRKTYFALFMRDTVRWLKHHSAKFAARRSFSLSVLLFLLFLLAGA